MKKKQKGDGEGKDSERAGDERGDGEESNARQKEE